MKDKLVLVDVLTNEVVNVMLDKLPGHLLLINNMTKSVIFVEKEIYAMMNNEVKESIDSVLCKDDYSPIDMVMMDVLTVLIDVDKSSILDNVIELISLFNRFKEHVKLCHKHKFYIIKKEQ